MYICICMYIYIYTRTRARAMEEGSLSSFLGLAGVVGKHRPIWLGRRTAIYIYIYIYIYTVVLPSRAIWLGRRLNTIKHV